MHRSTPSRREHYYRPKISTISVILGTDIRRFSIAQQMRRGKDSCLGYPSLRCRPRIRRRERRKTNIGKRLIPSERTALGAGASVILTSLMSKVNREAVLRSGWTLRVVGHLHSRTPIHRKSILVLAISTHSLRKYSVICISCFTITWHWDGVVMELRD